MSGMFTGLGLDVTIKFNSLYREAYSDMFYINCYVLKYFLQLPLLRISLSSCENTTTNGGCNRRVASPTNDPDNPNQKQVQCAKPSSSFYNRRLSVCPSNIVSFLWYHDIILVAVKKEVS